MRIDDSSGKERAGRNDSRELMSRRYAEEADRIVTTWFQGNIMSADVLRRFIEEALERAASGGLRDG